MEVYESPRRGRARQLTVHVISVCTLLAHVCWGAPLRAAPSAPEVETARSLMEQGDRLNASGDLRGALARYQSAHAIMHVPTTGIQIARVQAKLGLLVEARVIAMEVVNLPVGAGEPRPFAEARQSAGALARELEPRVPQLTTTVTPSDAVYRVIVDGSPVPTEARTAPYRTNPGVHVVRVEAAGFLTEAIQVDLAERQSRTVVITLKPLAKADATPTAVPPSPAPAPAESPAPQITAAAMHGDAGTYDPAASGRLRAMIGLSVGGAALVIGTVAGIASANKVSAAKEGCPNNVCNPSTRAALSSADTLATVANIGIPLGVVGIAYGFYELLTLPATGRSSASTRGVHLALTGNGVALGGSL